MVDVRYVRASRSKSHISPFWRSAHLVVIRLVMWAIALGSSMTSPVAASAYDESTPPAKLAYLFAASTYHEDQPFPQLPSTSEDFQRISALLKSPLGFIVRANQNAEYGDLTGGLKDQIVKDIAQYAPGGHAVVLILFVGHGVTVGSHDFVIPIDGHAISNRESPIDIGNYVDVGFFSQTIADANASVGLVLIDACRTAAATARPRAAVVRARTTLPPTTTATEIVAAIERAIEPQIMTSFSTLGGRPSYVEDGTRPNVYLTAIDEEMPKLGISVSEAFSHVSDDVHQRTRDWGEDQRMDPQTSQGVFGQVILNPTQQQLLDDEKSWKDAATVGTTAIRTWMLDHPIAHQVPAAVHLLRLHPAGSNTEAARAGVIRIREGCGEVKPGYFQCLGATNAFGLLNDRTDPNDPYSRHAGRNEALAAAPRVLVSAGDGKNINVAPISAAGVPTAPTAVVNGRVLVPTALDAETWPKRAGSSLFAPCRLDRPLENCAAVEKGRFSKQQLKNDYFEILAVAAAQTDTKDEDVLSGASAAAINLAAQLIRAGAEPSHVSYYYADSDFKPGFAGLAFVRHKERPPL
jgi:hypothetical protein